MVCLVGTQHAAKERCRKKHVYLFACTTNVGDELSSNGHCLLFRDTFKILKLNVVESLVPGGHPRCATYCLNAAQR